MKIGYAALVSDEVFNFMREFEVEVLESFGVNRGLAQPPHITIKGPFETDNLQWHSDYLDSLASQTRPFTIHAKGIRAFGPHAVFIDVMNNPTLHRLTQTILGDLPDATHTSFEVERSIHHHATVALPDSEEISEKIMAQYSDLNVQFEFTVEKLALFYQHEDSWIIYRKARVGN